MKKMPDMIHIRYNFPLLYIDNRLYAFGGRQYGDNHEAILKDCEFFDFNKK